MIVLFFFELAICCGQYAVGASVKGVQTVNLSGIQQYASITIVADSQQMYNVMQIEATGGLDVNASSSMGVGPAELIVNAASADSLMLGVPPTTTTTVAASSGTPGDSTAGVTASLGTPGGSTASLGTPGGSAAGSGGSTTSKKNDGSRLGVGSVMTCALSLGVAVAVDSTPLFGGAIALCANSYARGQTSCYLSVILTLNPDDLQSVTFSSIPANSSVSCQQRFNMSNVPSDLVNIVNQNYTFPIEMSGGLAGCPLGSAYQMTMATPQTCTSNLPSIATVVPIAIGMTTGVSINNQAATIVRQGQTSADPQYSLSIPSLPGKELVIWNGDLSNVRMNVHVDACDYVYSCIAGYCATEFGQFANDTYCAVYTQSTDLPASPPAPMNTSCDDFAMAGSTYTQNSLWQQCLQQCNNCPRNVQTCCGAAGAPVINCSYSYDQGCYASSCTNNSHRLCVTLCTGSNCAPCTGSDCASGCACSPVLPYVQGCFVQNGASSHVAGIVGMVIIVVANLLLHC
jgi:hypothetical protein